MLSKTELLPVQDRLKEAGRHLAHVKGSLRHIKCVEEKQILNDLVGAIESQRKAVEQMLEVLDAVARHDFLNGRNQKHRGTDTKFFDRKELRKRMVRGEVDDSVQTVFRVASEQELTGIDPLPTTGGGFSDLARGWGRVFGDPSSTPAEAEAVSC